MDGLLGSNYSEQKRFKNKIYLSKTGIKHEVIFLFWTIFLTSNIYCLVHLALHSHWFLREAKQTSSSSKLLKSKSLLIGVDIIERELERVLKGETKARRQLGMTCWHLKTDSSRGKSWSHVTPAVCAKCKLFKDDLNVITLEWFNPTNGNWWKCKHGINVGWFDFAFEFFYFFYFCVFILLIYFFLLSQTKGFAAPNSNIQSFDNKFPKNFFKLVPFKASDWIEV